MTRSERGFSLVEVMATLAVMALAIGMVASSVSASLTRDNQTSNDPVTALRRVMSVIGSAVASPAPAGGLARIAPLFGDEQRIVFVTAEESDGGLIANRFVSSPEMLTWDRKPIRQEREIVSTSFLNADAIHVPHLMKVQFSYRARGEGDWRSIWPVGPTAPVLVRVRIGAKGGRIVDGVVRIGSD